MTFKVDGANGLTFPDTTTQAVSALTAGKLDTSKLPIGTVLQTVQATTGSNISTSSSSYQASGLIASITPISSTSKILVTVTGGGAYNAGSNVGGDNKIYRQIASGGYSALGGNEVDWCGPQASGTTIVIPHSFSRLDSPATTSTVYYQPYYRVNPVGSGGTYAFNVSYYSNMTGIIAITLMEIAA